MQWRPENIVGIKVADGLTFIVEHARAYEVRDPR